MPEITITIAKDGSTQVAVQGYAGAGCLTLTAGLEKALGATQDQWLTSEYYQEAQGEGQEAGQG